MKFNIVPVNERPSFLFKHFKDGLFDLTIFKAARQFIKDYKGGYWDFVTTETGVPFMMLRDQHEYILVRPSTGEELTVDNTLAGLIITHSVLLGKIQDGMDGLAKQHRDLKETLANACIELDRGDILEALLH